MSQVSYNITLDITEMPLDEAEAFIDMIRKRAKVDHLSNLKWDILGKNPQLMGPLPGEDKNQKTD